MASTSMETMILFIAGILVAVGVAGALTGQVQQISAAIDDAGVDAADDIRSDVEVISDPNGEVYNRSGNENVTLLVKNTGSASLPADDGRFDVLVDGRYRGSVGVTVLDADSWGRGDVVRLNVSTGALDAGDHRVKLIVEGDEEVFEFRT